MIPTWHTHIAGDKLWQESQVETNEDDQCCESSPAFWIHASGNLGPPVMQATEIAHQSSADHDVVEMRDNEVGIAKVHVHRERGQKQPRHTADGEESDETESVKHWRIVGDRRLIKRSCPVEDLYCRGNGNGETQE